MNSKELHERFKSEKSRFETIKKIFDGEVQIFQTLKLVDPKTQRLEITPVWSEGVVVSSVYERKETKTYIFQISTAQGARVAAKLYAVSKEELKTGDNEYVEVRYLKLLNELCFGKRCPHSTLLYGHVVLTLADASSLFPNILPASHYLLVLAEMADTNLNLEVQSGHLSEPALIGVLLQCFITLTVLHGVFPSFRHNDLHMANVLLQKLPSEERLYVKYTIYKKEYWIGLDVCPYRILLWDMNHSSIDNNAEEHPKLETLVPNKTKMHGAAKSNQNQYYDLHKLLDSMEYVIKARKLSNVYPTVLGFVTDVVPTDLKCMTKNLTIEQRKDLGLWKNEPTTAKKVLENHDLFAQFRTKPQGNYRVLCKYVFPCDVSTKKTL